MHRLFFSTICICICFHAVCQLPTLNDFDVKTYTIANGLSNNNIGKIIKDKQGYIWICTTNGLSRYDGSRFVNFYHKPSDSTTLSHNYIQSILCDAAGNIWVLHVLGLSLYHPENQQFTNYNPTKYFLNFSKTYLNLEADEEGNIWLSNQFGLAIFNINQKTFYKEKAMLELLHLKNSDGFKQGINGIKQGKQGTLWLNNTTSLMHWNPATKELLPFTNAILKGAQGLAVMRVDTLENQVYLSSFNKGLIIFNINNQQWKQVKTGEDWLSTPFYDPIRSLQPFSTNYLACISDLAIGFYNKQLQKLEALKPIPFSRDVNLQYLLVDAGNFWLGTDKGLTVLKKRNTLIENITPTQKPLGTFSTIQFSATDNLIFTSNYGGKRPFGFLKNSKTITQAKGTEGILRYYFNDKLGRNWMSTENTVYLKETNSKTWNNITFERSAQVTSLVMTRNFCEDNAGGIWLRVRNRGLYKWNEQNQHFEQEISLPTIPNPIYSGMAYNPNTNSLWMSEENSGLYEFKLGEKRWLHHPLLLQNTQLTPSKLVIGKKGEIAFPDPFNGIGFYNPTDRKIKLITQENGLLSNNCSSIEVDSMGNIWTFSSEGISKISTTTHEVANITAPELVKIQEIICGSRGELLIATAEGIYALDGNLINPPKQSGKLLLDKIEVNGLSYPISNNFILHSGQNEIKIQISFVDLYKEFNSEFEYRWTSHEPWQSMGKQTQLSLSRLEAGNYNLTIREQHQTNSTQWQNLSWVIEKPFWKRAWFIGAFLMSIIGLVILISLKRVKSIKEKAGLKQKIIETEMAALRAQMNPHFIFNSINCIDAMVQDGDKYNATTYLNKFAKLIRNVLDGSLTNTVSLQTDIKTLEWYIELEHMRMDEKFDWKIEIDHTILLKDIKVPSLIIQPFVENAILHGLRHLTAKKGLLEISINYKNSSLYYTIKDNGVGRIYSKQLQKTKHSSYGIEITENRIKLANPFKKNEVEIIDLKQEDGTAAGTQVNVTLHLS